jgi:hypothetical protein
MADPFREHRLSPPDVRRILRRAAEIAERDPATAAAERSLTRDELDAAASALGLPQSAIARAVAHDEDREGTAPGSERSLFLGGPTRLSYAEEVEGEPSQAEREDLLEEIHEAMGETGAIESTGTTTIWKNDPGRYRGQGRELTVRIRTRRGRTRIVVEERLSSLATALFLGLGLGAGLAPLAFFSAATVAKIGAAAFVFPLLWIPLMLLLARTMFRAVAASRERSLESVMRRLTRSAASWSDGGAQRAAAAMRARVASVGDVAKDGEAEAEADAEAERSEGSRARR